VSASNGTGSKNFDSARSIFVAWIRLGQPILVWVWVWKISPKNHKFFFPSDQNKSLWVRSKSTRVKDRPASYLLQVKSMLISGQGPSQVSTLQIRFHYYFVEKYIDYLSQKCEKNFLALFVPDDGNILSFGYKLPEKSYAIFKLPPLPGKLFKILHSMISSNSF